MDSKILKSAGAAVAIVVVACLVFFLASMGTDYFFLDIAEFLLLATGLGFLSVYFFRKNKGDLTFLNIAAVVIAAVVMFCIILLPVLLAGDRVGFAFDVGGMYSIMMALFITLFFFFLFYTLACIGAMAAFLILTSKEEKKQWNIHTKVLVFILGSVLLVVLLGLIIDRASMPLNVRMTGPVITGCSRLQPISKSIVYKENESFTATFLNSAGTPISIDDVRVYEAITAMNCTIEAPSKGMKVGAGDTFEMDATCPPGANKNPGDTYSVDVNITFTAFAGGQNLTHVELGSIRGPVEE